LGAAFGGFAQENVIRLARSGALRIALQFYSKVHSRWSFQLSSNCVHDSLSKIDLNGNLNIWQAADLIIQHYRVNAQAAAARMADARRRKGDATGERAWLTIMMAIRELQRTERTGLEPLH
jgi:hypothetical protein